MNRYDLLFAAVLLLVFLPFFLIRPLYEVYETFNSAHGMVMSFIKFALLSTLGEMLGARISRGRYCPEGFGVVPKMIVWGILGMGINMAMIIFSNGVPVFLEYMGYSDAGADFAGGLTWGKVLVAFCISVAMNSIFAPVFMTLHKITDIHIADNKGSLKALIRPIPMAAVFSRIDWKAQWGFVFKKTIPLFWFPAHTVTFLLPAGARPLFAALLGVVLGVLLAVAGRKK
ncbi:hypothetical protein B5F83_08575 [Muribaculum sp. An289]|uniref:hypothetical protein n=1 Tax=unclassified Muribaculum TaxID=2622126 RepID=UPI000B384798|nr:MULTISPECIES: hypothetical protein [unclassified Muribaculum]OUO36485.1 hypothetical protein B5F83_08575 [Muribaculum sp. An289]OUO42128.1 hypothetical protein B5F81_08540 [Muribaculum sp. An287]